MRTRQFIATGFVVDCGFHGCDQQFTADAATLEAAQGAATSVGWRFLAGGGDRHLRNQWLCPSHSHRAQQGGHNTNAGRLQAPAVDPTPTQTDIEQAAYFAFQVGPAGLALIRRVETALQRKCSHSSTDLHYLFEKWARSNGYADTCELPGQTDLPRLDMALAAYGRARHDMGAE